MSSQKVDAYIAKAAPFARPILAHIRAIVHEAAPEIVEEIKWSSPFLTKEGQIVCSMSAFKAHCGLFFWKGALVVPEKGNNGDRMGQSGKLTSVDQLPPREVLAGYVRKALQLNAEGVPAPHVIKRRLQKTGLRKTALRKTSSEKTRGAGVGGRERGRWLRSRTQFRSPPRRRRSPRSPPERTCRQQGSQ